MMLPGPATSVYIRSPVSQGRITGNLKTCAPYNSNISPGDQPPGTGIPPGLWPPSFPPGTGPPTDLPVCVDCSDDPNSCTKIVAFSATGQCSGYGCIAYSNVIPCPFPASLIPLGAAMYYIGTFRDDNGGLPGGLQFANYPVPFATHSSRMGNAGVITLCNNFSLHAGEQFQISAWCYGQGMHIDISGWLCACGQTPPGYDGHSNCC